MGVIAGYTVFWVVPGTFLTGVAVAGGIALVNSMGNLGGFIAPFAIGWIKQGTGSFTDALLVLAGAMAASGVIAFLIRPARDEVVLAGEIQSAGVSGKMSKGTGGYVILVRFRAKAGQDREFAKQMLSVVPATRSEPGNRQFEFYVDQDDPLNFMLYEEFVDEAALQVASRAAGNGGEPCGHQADARRRAGCDVVDAGVDQRRLQTAAAAARSVMSRWFASA